MRYPIIIFSLNVCLLITGLSLGNIKNLHNKEEALPAVRSAIMSKQYGNEDFLAGIITDACSK